MAMPRKADKDKAIKQTISVYPEQMERLLKFCQKEERELSWVYRKALEEFLTKHGY